MEGTLGRPRRGSLANLQLLSLLHHHRLAFAFAGLLLLGAVGRICTAYHANLALAHPDEHQQYLEQAIVEAYGYGVTFWEQDRHMRHPLYPTVLAGLVRALDFLGLTRPQVQAIFIRVCLSLVILGLAAAHAYRWWQEGDPAAALFLLFVMAAAIDVYYIQSRVLSENAMAIPLLLALFLERHWPAAAGFCLAVMFAIRFQSSLLIAPWLLAGAWQGSRAWRAGEPSPWRPLIRLSAGLALGLILMGAWDWLAFGRWFHSPLEYFQASALERGASQFGVKPFYSYFVLGSRDLLRASLLIPLLLWASRRTELRLLWLIGACVIAHSVIGHKEMRFLWMLLPLLAMVLAKGFATLWQAGQVRYGLAMLIALSFLVPSLIRLPKFRWLSKPYASSSLALEWVAQQPDVTGVGVIGVPDHKCGNHFYFRKNLPLMLEPQRYPDGVDRQSYVRGPLGLPDQSVDYVLEQIQAAGGMVNYLIVSAPERERLGQHEVVRRVNNLYILRVR